MTGDHVHHGAARSTGLESLGVCSIQLRGAGDPLGLKLSLFLEGPSLEILPIERLVCKGQPGGKGEGQGEVKGSREECFHDDCPVLVPKIPLSCNGKGLGWVI